ncbi:MAG: universal stress protein, partial [Acidimicrobiales bacterium]
RERRGGAKVPGRGERSPLGWMAPQLRGCPMNATTSAQPPRLFDRNEVAQLLVPVMADQRSDRGVGVALQLAEDWDLPVTLLHIGALDGDADAPPSAVADMAIDLRRHHPAVTIETEAFDHEDVAIAIAEAAGSDTLVVLATDHASQWLGDDSVAERLVQRRSAPLLLIGPRARGYHASGEVIVALDGTRLAEDGVAVGLALAAAAETAVRVVTVIPTATLEHIEHLKERGQRVSESSYLRELADGLVDQPAPVAWEIVHERSDRRAGRPCGSAPRR